MEGSAKAWVKRTFPVQYEDPSALWTPSSNPGDIHQGGPQPAEISWFNQNLKKRVAQNGIRPETGRIIQQDIKAKRAHGMKLPHSNRSRNQKSTSLLDL
jgi:hypothetical protein